jgi:hypothetical protein
VLDGDGDGDGAKVRAACDGLAESPLVTVFVTVVVTAFAPVDATRDASSDALGGLPGDEFAGGTAGDAAVGDATALVAIRGSAKDSVSPASAAFAGGGGSGTMSRYFFSEIKCDSSFATSGFATSGLRLAFWALFSWRFWPRIAAQRTGK